MASAALAPYEGFVQISKEGLVVAGAVHVMGVVRASSSHQASGHHVLQTPGKVVTAVVVDQQPNEHRNKHSAGQRVAGKQKTNPITILRFFFMTAPLCVCAHLHSKQMILKFAMKKTTVTD